MLTLGWFQQRQKALLRTEHHRPQTVIEFFAAGRDTQKPRAPVGTIYSTLDQALAFELFNEKAHIIAIDADPRGETVLIDIRLALDISDNCVVF